MDTNGPDSTQTLSLGARLRSSLTVFGQREVAAVGALGFAAGLPLAIKGQALQARMAEAGLKPSEIGLFSLAGLPYVLKFLWSPLLDIVPPPGPFKALGRRRGWLLLIQIALMAAVVGLGMIDPRANPWGLAAMAVMVAFISASQDIVIDALRIEQVAADSQSAALALYVALYRIALLVAAAGTLAGVAGLEHLGLSRDLSWRIGYGGLAALLSIGVVGTLAMKNESDAPSTAVAVRSFSLRANFFEPLRSILARPQALTILAFVLLFKLGDAMADTMTLPFALAIGFDKATYAWAASSIGLVATLLGGFLAGIVERTIGPWRTLWIGAFVQAIANFSLTWLAMIGPEAWALVVANSINNLGHGFGAVVFTAFLSRLCTDREITATHYALLSSLAVVGRTIMVGPSGYLAEALGWPLFFAATVGFCLPGIALLYVLDRGQRQRAALLNQGAA